MALNFYEVGIISNIIKNESEQSLNLSKKFSKIKILPRKDEDSSVILGTGNLRTDKDEELKKILGRRVVSIFFKIYPKGEYTNNIEILIYKKIINDILHFHFSPNVVGYLASFECKNFLNTVASGLKSKNMIKKKNFQSIENQIEEITKSDYDFNEASFLVLENVKGPNLETWLDSITENAEQQIMPVVFQMLYTLQIFNIFGLRHNDLHEENTLIQVDKVSTFYVYFITNNVYFAIPCGAIPKIFDFDLSSVIDIKNTMLDKYRYCVTYGICNSSNLKFDTFTFLKHLFDVAERKGWQFLTDFCLKSVDEALYHAHFKYRDRLCSLTTQTMEMYKNKMKKYNKKLEMYKTGKLTKKQLGSIPLPPEDEIPLTELDAIRSGISSVTCKGNWEPSDDLVKSIPQILMLPEFEKYKHSLPNFDPFYKPKSVEDFQQSNIFFLPTVECDVVLNNLINKKIRKIKF